MNFKEMRKYADEVAEHVYPCKCGRKVFIGRNRVKSICDWCGRSVYKNAREEFIDRLETKLYGRKN